LRGVSEEDRLHPEFADLWPGSRGRIDESLAALERAVAAVEAGALDEDVRAEAEARAHKLVGTLGTYGLLRSAELARELEYEFFEAPASDEAAALRTRLDALAAGVRAAA
jgi:HPt (histidine-containing phosphotransfer) domain-containing protein